jgi:hypothetical protein
MHGPACGCLLTRPGILVSMASTDPDRTRAALEAEIARLAAVIGAEDHYVVGFDPYVDYGYPYIEIGTGGLLHWIVKERGQVLEHRVTTERDEVLYWSFQSATFSLASTWELHHRDPAQDSRIRLWAKQAELLHALDPAWARRWRDELAQKIPSAVPLMPLLPADEGTGEP